LFSRQYVRMYLLDARGFGEMAGRLLVITGNQARVDAERMQAAHRIRCVGPQSMAKRNQAEKHSFFSNADHRQTLRFEFVDASFLSGKIHCSARDKSGIARDQSCIAKPRPDTLTRDCLEFMHLSGCNPTFERLFHDCPAEWVF